ncbi:receptor-like protein kinase FERONIA [Rosa sericea]
MKPILTLLYLFLFVYVVTLLVAGDLASTYTPVENITLACGTYGTVTQYYSSYENATSAYDNSRDWSGDINSKFSPIGSSSTTQVNTSISDYYEVPYETARLSHSEFTYRFNLTADQKFIRLYFYPAFYTNFNRSKARFSVKAGDFTLLDNFNASDTADASGEEKLYREFCLNVDEEQSLKTFNITFSPSKDAYAFINGIEIVSMPTSLYYSAAKSDGLRSIGDSQLKNRIENSTALQTLYRLDIAGDPTSSYEYMYHSDDVYRGWNISDDVYLDSLSKTISELPHNYTIQLKFVKIPEYSAPEYVYLTGRSMGKNKYINKSYNLTWIFPVDSSFHYLVRLHLCEFEPGITQSGDRKFQININSQTVEEGADIIQWSGGIGIPVYKDYVVYMSSPENEKKVNLSLTLAADEKSSYNEAILNGLEIFKLLDSNVSYDAPRNPDSLQLKRPKKSSESTPTVAIVAGVISSIIVFSVIGFLVFRRGWKAKDSRSSHRTKKSVKVCKSSLPTYFCRHFSLPEIKVATENFNATSIIGVGGFGNVYKGQIDGEATLVAIKRLKPDSSQGAHEFKTEIELLSQIRHRHLVSLIGYCNDKGEMILVYDYMARGTLRDHLYNTENPPLPWKERLQICIGAAQGLQYLHSGARGSIIHRDVKSTNILLDKNWVAKVSDFGLSKGTNDMSKTHISTLVKGSFRYLDPEYFRTQHLTPQSDVYSFGVVLCEVLCARPAVIHTEEIRQASLAEWAKSCHQNGEIDQIIDPILRGNITAECLNKFTEVAISCMHDNGTERPSMTDVVRGLELALQLQQSAEGNINCIERNVETETSSSEKSCATNDSIKCISATIFSEINNPSGR